MNRTFTGQPAVFIWLFLVVATTAVYLQVLGFDFTNYDDPKYVTENTNVQQGLTRGSIHWAFTTGYASNWHPLTWLSLMLDRHLFGANAGAFHLTNLLLHIANTVLLFIVLSRCTSAVHVESVAWIAERKDVLSTFFWMLTMLAYVRFAQRPRVARYLPALAAFAMGLMAKPMLVTLPCVLLLLDYWPLGRIKIAQSTGPPTADSEERGQLSIGATKSLFFLVLEKIPFFILAAASSVVTFIVQKSGGAVAKMQVFPLNVRIANALVSYISYIAKMFWPARLAVFYPHPRATLPTWQVLIATVFLLCISALVIWKGRRRRYLVVGWLWYIGTLVPVTGLVQVGEQAMADRYSYVPLTGLFIIVAWSARELLLKWQYRKIVCALLASMVVAAMMICTWLQLGHWRNSTTLFARALKVTSNKHVAHNNLGIALAEQNNIKQAMEHFTATLKIKPNDIDAHLNLAKALTKQNKTEQAIEHCNQVLRLQPDNAIAHNFLGLALAEQGKATQAIAVYRRGLGFNPADAILHSNLGRALLQQGRLDEAVSEFQTALELSPDSKTHSNLGVALAFKGEFDEAIKHYGEAIRLEPENAKAHYILANALMAQGRFEEAVSQYRETLRIDPQHTKARQALIQALAEEAKSNQDKQ